MNAALLKAFLPCSAHQPDMVGTSQKVVMPTLRFSKPGHFLTDQCLFSLFCGIRVRDTKTAKSKESSRAFANSNTTLVYHVCLSVYKSHDSYCSGIVIRREFASDNDPTADFSYYASRLLAVLEVNTNASTLKRGLVL